MESETDDDFGISILYFAEAHGLQGRQKQKRRP